MRLYIECIPLIALALLACGCQNPAMAGKKPRPVTEAELFGAWIGLTEDGIYFFRIELEGDGTGLGAYAYLHEEAKLLQVNKWGTQNGKIQVPLMPLDNDLNHIHFITGSAHSTVMDLTAFGRNWRRRLVLRREDDLDGRAGLVKRRMQEHQAILDKQAR